MSKLLKPRFAGSLRDQNYFVSAASIIVSRTNKKNCSKNARTLRSEFVLIFFTQSWADIDRVCGFQSGFLKADTAWVTQYLIAIKRRVSAVFHILLFITRQSTVYPLFAISLFSRHSPTSTFKFSRKGKFINLLSQRHKNVAIDLLLKITRQFRNLTLNVEKIVWRIVMWVAKNLRQIDSCEIYLVDSQGCFDRQSHQNSSSKISSYIIFIAPEHEKSKPELQVCKLNGKAILAWH